MAPSADEVLATLRTHTRPRLALRGFGPLVVAVVFLIAMMLLLPSVAPEQTGERPVSSTETVERSK